MNVYRPVVVEGYEWALPTDSGNFERIHTLGERPIAATWTPITFKLIKNGGDGRQRMPADIPWFADYALVLRARAVAAVSPFLGDDAELLPLKCSDAELWLLHVYRTVDALDESQSTIVRFRSSGGGIMSIDRAAFDPSKLTGIRFFRVPQYLRGSLWVTDDVADSVRASGLTGVGFRLASEPEYGPSGDIERH